MRRVLVAAVLVLLSAIAVPDRGAAQNRSSRAVPAVVAVQQLLDTRADAVRRKDRAAFLATVDPRASDRFKMAQAVLFDGLQSLPLASYRLTARTDDTGDLGPGIAARYAPARVFLPETRQTYRFEGYDDRDAVDTLWLTFVKRGDRWYVASDNDLTAVGLDTARGLWDQGAVRVSRTPHFLVLSHPDQAARANDLAGLAERAMELLNQRWNQPWSQRIPLILPSSKGELATILQSPFDLDNFVAFVAYGSVRDAGWEATAPRIYIQDDNLSRYSNEFQLQTLTHELTHAAAVPLTGPLIPAWVHEGLADWVARGQLSEDPPNSSDGRLPRDYEFSTGGGAAIVGAYEESRSAASFLSARVGRDGPAELFRRLGANKVAAGDIDGHVDRVLRELTGLNYVDFERNWSEG